MLFRPDRTDYTLVGRYTSQVVIGVGVLMLVPAGFGALLGEVNEALGFLVGASLALLVSVPAAVRLRSDRDLDRSHGFVIAGLSWLVAPFFAAVPLYLSGHYSAFLDAYFDAMSGFATAGLSVINDLDHLADSVNLWRHLMQYVGGQGLVLVVLSLFAAGGGAVTMYVGEAREERIVPNVIRTARFIATVSLAWLAIATPVIVAALLVAGQPPADALFHGLNLFMAAFATGGFAPMTASVGFYQSALLEGVLAVVMLAGATSFGLHYQLWHRRAGELTRHLEARTFALSVLGLFAIAAVGLVRSGTYATTETLLRRGFFHVLSAQTGTGFATLPSPTIGAGWGDLAPAMLVAAMGIGAMSGSTGGGIKTIRVGLAAKALKLDVRRILAPASAQLLETYHAGTRRVLRTEVTAPAVMILLLFLVLYAVGALIGMFYGYPFDQAFFESVSAAGTVGLSVGITGPSMPTGMKVLFILQMWMGRLELVAVFALIGFGWSAVRGRV